MKLIKVGKSASHEWVALLGDILANGFEVSPRGKRTLELPQRTVVVDMTRPVVTLEARKLSYKFMAGEAYWMLTGDDSVAGITPFNKNIAQFSDDGVTFFGAYGPKIVAQLGYVVQKLCQDPCSRQAVINIWRENPPQTKDYPCTLSMVFSIRAGELNMHVFMRSNDAWLGTPYDVFNFSMVAHLVCARLNELIATNGDGVSFFEPGALYLTAASSHLYEQHFEAARKLVHSAEAQRFQLDEVNLQVQTPRAMHHSAHDLLCTLDELRTSVRGDTARWWVL